MDRDETKRTEIENRLISKVSDIQLRTETKDGIYIDLKRFDEFLDECENLVRYYKVYSDTVIGVEVVRVYADLVRYFRELRLNMNDRETAEKAQDYLYEVEGWMDDIISAAAKNWQNMNPNN